MRTRNFPNFFKKYWLEIIAVFPAFLILRLVEKLAPIAGFGETLQASLHETMEIEKEIVLKKGKKIGNANVSEKLLELMIYFVRLLREDKNLEKKPSVRASLGLYERSQSNALLNNRKNVTFEDLMAIIVSVLAHRIRLKPSIKYLQAPEKYVADQFEKNIIESKVLEEKKGDLL